MEKQNNAAVTGTIGFGVQDWPFSGYIQMIYGAYQFAHQETFFVVAGSS